MSQSLVPRADSDHATERSRHLAAVRLAGYLLWRGGMLLGAAGVALWVARAIFAGWRLPPALAWGATLVLGGLALVLLSLVLERRRDEAIAS